MKKLSQLKDLQLMANTIRQDLMKMLHAAGSGHCAGPLGLVEIMTTLYFNQLNHDSKKPTWEKRDRLILSNGHVCPVRYAVMAEAGYFPVKELMTLRKLGTRLQGHPSRLDLPGLEVSTASLGQGIGIAVGMALAAKLKKEKHFIFCISSDGEHDEGSTWEAVNAASKYKLSNFINIIDRNHIQISGKTEDVWPLKSLKEKYLSYNWNVEVIDGHDFKKIISTIEKAKQSDKPFCIIADTIPGKGISFMENDYTWHGRTPKDEDFAKAMKELEAERKRI